MNFCTLWKLKMTKSQDSESPKLQKLVFSKLLGSQKLISHRIWVTEKCWNFNTVLQRQFFRQINFHSLFSFLARFVPMNHDDKSETGRITKLQCQRHCFCNFCFILSYQNPQGGWLQPEDINKQKRPLKRLPKWTK